MLEIVTATTAIIKAIGARPMLELAKNAWIKFCIGTGIVLLCGGADIVSKLIH